MAEYQNLPTIVSSYERPQFTGAARSLAENHFRKAAEMPCDDAYDQGYASIDPIRRVGPNLSRIDAACRVWGPATIKLHLGWLSTQLRINPADQFRWGRHDALCDLLVTFERLIVEPDDSLLQRLPGQWRKSN